MPITDIASYPIVMQEFIEHWADVNAALGGEPATDFKLTGGYPLATFISDRATLAAIIISINSDPDLPLAITLRDAKKGAIRIRLTHFRATVAGQLSGSPYPTNLPLQPKLQEGEGRFLDPFDDMSRWWATINGDVTIPGFTPPLILQGGYTQTDFTTELAALRTAYTAVGSADDNARLARAQRDKQMKAAYERMKQYRTGIFGALPADDPLLTTVPDLTPPQWVPLNPVLLNAVWNAATSMADLNWTASTDVNLGEYSVRYVPGLAAYDPNNEILIVDLPVTALSLSTDDGLLSVGVTAQFRVYAVRTTGAETGSNIVVVTRP